MRTAVIVAAGLGSRLKHHTTARPKGFVEVEGEALIDRSLGRLMRAGIERVVIGTGYLAEHYDALANRYRGTLEVHTLRSDRYETTSSMYTLYNLRSLISDDFVLLESDLLYEQRALDTLIGDPRRDALLVSGFTDSRDEVWVEVDADRHLHDVSKDRTRLGDIHGELVGITKVSFDAYRRACGVMEEELHTNPKLDYEGCLVRVSRAGHRVPVVKVDDLAWCEIDDEGHLERAVSKILPRIRENDAAR
jgi:2-aminoethylphosphonate-pyruvate transaminase